MIVAGAAIFWGVRYQLRILPLRQHLYRGIEFAANRQMLDAERAWKEAIRLDDKYWPAWKLLAQNYSLSGRWSEAREAWERVSRLAPGEPHVQCELANTCWALGDEISARDAAAEELRRDHRCVRALSLGAETAIRLNNQKKAIIYLRRALRENPNEPELLFRLASLLVGAYSREQARELLVRLVRLSPNHADAHGLLGLTYLESSEIRGHLKLAERDLARSLELDADSADAHLAMARLRRQQNLLRQALEHLDAAIVLDPYRQRAYYELARVCDALGLRERADKARQHFLKLKESSLQEERLTKLCAVEFNNFEHHLELGLLKMNAGDFRRAEVYLRRALELKPDHPQALAAWKSLDRARTTGAASIMSSQ